MTIMDSSLRDYIDRLSARTPVPGAGSTAALTAMLAAALALMAAKYSAAADDQHGAMPPALEDAAADLSAVLRRCESLMSDDISDFAHYIAARRAAADAGSAERGARSVQLEARAQSAAAVPLRIARACGTGLDALVRGAGAIAAQVRADWYAGAHLFAAAARSALLAAEASAAALPEPPERDELAAECRQLSRELDAKMNKLLYT
jgi:methenyltetrahydrofolate cyclohydrolase